MTAPPAGSAARRWSDLLTARAIPQHVLDGAPANPYHQDPARFLPPEAPVDTPSRRAGLDLLAGGDRGEVLDVGCGAGAASLALRPAVRQITGIDDATDMLAAFAAACLERAVPYYSVLGHWPSGAAAAGRADVVVCHHVGYNAADLAPFVTALSAAARRGVVMELHARHPLAWLDPLWERFHGLDRPPPATVDDALAVIDEVGIAPSVQRWRTDRTGDEPLTDRARRTCRRLCLPESRAGEVAEALRGLDGPSAQRVTVSWSTG